MPTRNAAVIASAVLLALPLLARPARASIDRVYEAGAWALWTGTSTSGRPVCDMRVSDNANSKRIDVIYFNNDDHLTVRMNKTTWQIPDKTRVGIVLQFDAYPVWTATADGAGQDVEFTVPTNALTDFSRQFRYGSRMRITFPEGSEAPWLASLSGTNFMLDRFLECLQRIRGSSTQPYADTPARPAPPTQPTQPFANGGQAPQGDEGTPSFGGHGQPYRGDGSGSAEAPAAPPAPPAPEPAPAPAPAPAAPAPAAPGNNDDRI